MWTVREKLRRLGIASRRSDELAKDDRDARDAAIEEANSQHLSVREIAEEVGLSPAGVQQIIIRRTAERQDRLAHQARLGGPPVGPTGTN